MLTVGGEPLHIGPLHEDDDAYTLVARVGAGGQGTVWKAELSSDWYRHTLVRALKVMRPATGSAIRADDLDALQSLVHLLAQAHVPHLVTLHRAFVAAPPHEATTAAALTDQVLVLDMEFVEGPTVDEVYGGTRATRASLLERLQTVHDVAAAVAALHSDSVMAGNTVVFRDIKPTNCMLHATRGAVLVDAGTIQLPTADGDPRGLHTPEYSAPEVLADARRAQYAWSDAWSLGMFAAFCVLGTDPPRRAEPLKPMLRSAVIAAGGTIAIADHLLALVREDAAERPSLRDWVPSFGALIGELGEARKRRRRRRTGAAVAGAAVLGILAAGLTAGAAMTATLAGAVRPIQTPATTQPVTGPDDPPSRSSPTPAPDATPTHSSASRSAHATSSASASASSPAIVPVVPVRTAVAPPKPTKSTLTASRESCLGTAITGSFTLPAGGSTDSWVGGGPNGISSACDFIALKLTQATYVTYARACLDTASGPGAGRCGGWVRLHYPDTWDTLLTGVSASTTWTLEMYGEADESVAFSYTR